MANHNRTKLYSQQNGGVFDVFENFFIEQVDWMRLGGMRRAICCIYEIYAKRRGGGRCSGSCKSGVLRIQEAQTARLTLLRTRRAGRLFHAADRFIRPAHDAAEIKNIFVSQLDELTGGIGAAHTGAAVHHYLRVHIGQGLRRLLAD